MEVFKYILPAFIVMMTAYLMFDKMMSRQDKKQRMGLDNERKSAVIPIRLRSYERLMLLIERTNPSTMVMQVIKPGMSCVEFQTLLLDYIRKEYEHNYSQQIYVSDQLWKAIGLTRETIVRHINNCAKEFQPEDSASQMAEMLITTYAAAENNPSQFAADLLKSETKVLFFPEG